MLDFKETLTQNSILPPHQLPRKDLTFPTKRNKETDKKNPCDCVVYRIKLSLDSYVSFLNRSCSQRIKSYVK